MVKSTHKFKVGDKVRILDVDAILFGGDYFNNGDVTACIEFTPEGNSCFRSTKTDDTYLVITPEEYHAIELVEGTPKSATKKQRISTLEQDYEALKLRVELLEKRSNETSSVSDGPTKVSDEIAITTTNLKVGDFVINRSSPYDYLTIGKKYVVAYIDDDGEFCILDDDACSELICLSEFDHWRKVTS